MRLSAELEAFAARLGHRFADEQLRGPYVLWRHSHTFEPEDGGTMTTDRVQYIVPGGPLAGLVHRLEYVHERTGGPVSLVGWSLGGIYARELARSVREAVRARAWDATRGLFRDTPDGESYSQQANVLAVLTGAVPQDQKAALVERVLSEDSLTQSTYYFSYYQLEALREAGLGERYVEQLAPCRGMLDLGLVVSEGLKSLGHHTVDDLEVPSSRQLLVLDDGEVGLDAGRVAVHHERDGARGSQDARLGVAEPVLRSGAVRLAP